MSIRLKYSLPALLQLSAVFFAASPSLAATWKTNVNYGGSGTTMDLYVPDQVDASPGVVVALHYCGGSAANAHSWFQSLADKYGFIIIAADAAGNCWDSSPARIDEKAAIVKMVDYVVTQNHADKAKVFSAGASSGACLTNTLLAVYPDVFAAGSVLAGVPVGAWPSGNTSCSGVCNATPPTKTAQAWGDIVRNAYTYSGVRPRVQLFHGSSDEYLYYPYLAEEVKQWTNVLGITDTGTNETNKPLSGWERTSYKNSSGAVALEVNTKQGEVHDLTGKGLFPDVIRFFGLDIDTTGTGGTSGVGGASSGGASGNTTSAIGMGAAPATTVPGTGGANAQTSNPPSSGGSLSQTTSGPTTMAGTVPSTTTTNATTDSGDGGGCSMTGTSETRTRSGAFAALVTALFGVMVHRRRRAS